MKYRTKLTITAYRWEGWDDLKHVEIHRFTTGSLQHTLGMGWIETSGGKAWITPGDWFTFDASGEIRVMNDTDFNNLFEKVET